MSARPANRSDEELAMRALIVPELRRRWPEARIVHELPLRYSTNRIDLAAITPAEIISVEIKSSRDVATRLEAQVRAFIPVSTQVIVALAPKWNEKLEPEIIENPGFTTWRLRYTEAQQVIQDIGDSCLETWTVDAEKSLIERTEGGYRKNRPWLDRMLHMLWVEELIEIAAKHRIVVGKRTNHGTIVADCADLMTGREVVGAVCAALRSRAAFASDSDAPILRSEAA